MSAILEKFDAWMKDTGPAALVIREHLMPIEGHDGVLFPATFAPSEDGRAFKGGYNVDKFDDGSNICLIDSVGSQANRIEPLFAKAEYANLVPQVIVRAGNKKVNLLEAGHRAGDAIVRCSALQEDLQKAFKAVLNGDCSALAAMAPTSLVFGAWDSRDTQAKLPRLIASTIRAFNVRVLTRSAQYVPAADYLEEGVLDEPGDLKDAEGKVRAKHPFAKWGFAHVPASSSPGGVIATGGVRRDASLHLAALRLLRAGEDPQRTISLQRYILGLALTAFTYCPSGYLRQGCSLVLDSSKPRDFVVVYGNGQRDPTDLTHGGALEYAQAAAAAFGVGENRDVDFDKEKAKKDLADNGKKAKKTAGKKSQ